MFCSTKNAIYDLIKQIRIFLNKYNKDEEIKKYLIRIKLTKILLLIFEKINYKKNDELIQNIFDCILFSISIINSNENNLEKDLESVLFENKKFKNYLKNNIEEFNSLFEERRISLNDENEIIKNNFVKTIILITNISIYCPSLINKIKDDFMESINNIKNIMNVKKEDKIIKLINKNISILSKIINIKN